MPGTKILFFVLHNNTMEVSLFPNEKHFLRKKGAFYFTTVIYNSNMKNSIILNETFNMRYRLELKQKNYYQQI